MMMLGTGTGTTGMMVSRSIDNSLADSFGILDGAQVSGESWLASNGTFPRFNESLSFVGMSAGLDPKFIMESTASPLTDTGAGVGGSENRTNSNFLRLVNLLVNESQFESSGENGTWELPIYMRFNEGNVVAIVFYSILMIISAVGNVTVLATIVRLRIKARLTRVNLFLLHLAIADLLVTFLLMPLEIGWAATVSWRAGDAMCRIMSFFRIFGLYLSGFLLVCISLDRYFAVLKPLTLSEANKRGRMMLYAAWGGSIICSLPQAIIFHVEKHPQAPWFEQCVTFNFFVSETWELAYSYFGFVFMYGFPLIMIIACYGCILYEIYKINNLNAGGDDIRRSSMGALGRAKTRTLKMTVVIVAAFFLCWTPYNIIALWYWIDKESAMQLDQRIQKGLFLFACTNSCVNPIVYGFFHIRRKKPEPPHAVWNGQRFQRGDDRVPYKVRVRWKPRAECLCAATSSSQINSSGGPYCPGRVGGGGSGLRPIYEVNGGPMYLSGQYKHSQVPNTCGTPRRLENVAPGKSSLHNGAGGSGKKKHVNAPRKSRRVKFVNLKDPDVILNSVEARYMDDHLRNIRMSTQSCQVKYINGHGHGGKGSDALNSLHNNRGKCNRFTPDCEGDYLQVSPTQGFGSGPVGGDSGNGLHTSTIIIPSSHL